MNKNFSYYFSIFLLFISILPLMSEQKKSPKDLPDRYKKWVQEEVVYIITAKEKDVFLKLETDKEREIFINAFWKQRDPTPNTPENEFRTEHYRRISYANQWFGRESPTPGWKTDMGRIYIILGPAKSVEKFENLTDVYPIIIWFYEGMAEYGLPNAFNVVFFKKSGMGEYELYSPIRYGPQSLMIHYAGDQTDYEAAYLALFEIEPTIAKISLNLIEGESRTPIPSIASEILLSKKIPAAPYEKVKDSYAEKLLMYKDIVEVDYTANYIDNDSLVRVIQDKSGISFVHYLVEPKKLTFEGYGRKFHSNLEINGRILDLKDNTIYQFEKTVPIDFNEDQLNKIKAKLFSFQDMFPLIRGDYKFNLLLKNTISKEFTSLEADITVPESPALQMSPLILANRIDKESKYKGENKPFLIGGFQLFPSPRNDFAPGDTLYLCFQIQGLTPDLKENASIEYSIFREEEKVHSLVKSIKDYPDQANFIEEFPLANFPPAYYKIKVSFLDKNQETILHEQGSFYITTLRSLPRPWVLSLPMPASEDPVLANILGIQFLNKKDLQKAKALLEQAYQKNPESPQFALDFCKALFLAKDYSRAKQIALSFFKEQGKYEFLQILAQSSQALGEFKDAISYYKEYLNHYGTNLFILNSIGECYYQLGNIEEALIAWEKSLEINPNQEKLKAVVKSLKEKK